MGLTLLLSDLWLYKHDTPPSDIILKLDKPVLL